MLPVGTYSVTLCSVGSRASKHNLQVWNLSVKEISTISFPLSTTPHDPDTTATRTYPTFTSHGQRPSSHPDDRLSTVPPLTEWPQATLLPTTSQPPSRLLPPELSLQVSNTGET